jgi:hypothetical protein
MHEAKYLWKVGDIMQHTHGLILQAHEIQPTTDMLCALFATGTPAEQAAKMAVDVLTAHRAKTTNPPASCAGVPQCSVPIRWPWFTP